MNRIFAVFVDFIIIAMVFFSPCGNYCRAESSAGESVEFAAPDGMFAVGEELLYEVSYSFFDLGSISIHVVEKGNRNGQTVYKAKAFIDSYSGIPFVNLHYIFYSEMNPGVFSHFFLGNDLGKKEAPGFVEYLFDYEKQKISWEKGDDPGHVTRAKGFDTASSPVQDGLSLFYYARANAHSGKKVNVPTFVNEKKVNTNINFGSKIGAMEIEAVKYPIRTIELGGTVDFVGLFGLTGEYKGFFSDDEAAIPIVAKMKVFIGSVHIELKKWNRPGWVPPRAD